MQWPNYLLAELSNTAPSFSRDGVVAASLVLEQSGQPYTSIRNN